MKVKVTFDGVDGEAVFEIANDSEIVEKAEEYRDRMGRAGWDEVEDFERGLALELAGVLGAAVAG